MLLVTSSLGMPRLSAASLSRHPTDQISEFDSRRYEKGIVFLKSSLLEAN